MPCGIYINYVGVGGGLPNPIAVLLHPWTYPLLVKPSFRGSLSCYSKGTKATRLMRMVGVVVRGIPPADTYSIS